MPTSEVEADADIEMGRIDTAQTAETDASDAVQTATPPARSAHTLNITFGLHY